MANILELLKGSDEPEADQRFFVKAQIVFWLLGAVDGHAKNFSIFLYPGGRFTLTPLYDVMSVQPAFDAGQVRRNEMKLAFAIGDNRHYVVHDIMPRHFVQTAKSSGISESVVRSIYDEVLETERTAVAGVLEKLPAGYPDELAGSIVDSLRSRLRRLRDA